MSGWAWFLLAMLVYNLIGIPALVGKRCEPLKGSVAVVLEIVTLVQTFAVLKLAGVL